MSDPKIEPLIDIGVNLLSRRFVADVDDVVERALAAGVVAMVVTGTDIDTSRQAPKLCERWEGCLFHTAGCHPHHADSMSEADWQQLETLFDTSPHLVAVGECGLDYHRNFSSPDNQRQVFARQLALAAKHRRPVFAHLREASDDFLAIVKEYRPELVGLCVHCFTDGPDVLEVLLDLDCDIGVTGWICDERRNHALTQAIGLIPDGRLMLETDAPYLLPRNLPNKPKNGRNEPCFLPHICREVAKLRRQPADAVARITTENAMRFFHLNVDEESDA
ncbi:MAG: hydrolase TatD [Gammaproteobacteria bacterium]|nr:MAG: hydrolase TatD [Gammaproteobacteria bacterium]